MANVKRVSLNLNRDREQEALILDWIESTSYAPSKIKDILYNYIVDSGFDNNTLRIETKSNNKKQINTYSNNEKRVETTSDIMEQQVMESNNSLQDEVDSSNKQQEDTGIGFDLNSINIKIGQGKAKKEEPKKLSMKERAKMIKTSGYAK